MLNKNSESPKKLTVTLAKGVNPIPTYDLFLIRGNSDYMEVQLARKTESEDEINVHVESIFRIPKDAVPLFARQFSKYLQVVTDKKDSQE